MSIWYKYSYIWITAVLFGVSFAIQWWTHDGDTMKFLNAVAENWQSEFLQLIWQVLGLKWFLCWGSPASRDSDDEMMQLVKQIHGRIIDDGK